MTTSTRDGTALVPTVTFRGVLKQVRTAELDEAQEAVLKLCFPEFLDRGARHSPLEHLGVRPPSAFQPRPEGWGRLRRYAGTATLTPGRYYSVCANEAGDDGGTLCKELMTYWNESTMAFPSLLDSTILPADARQKLEATARGPVLGIMVERYEWRRRFFGWKTLKKRTLGTSLLPLSVSRVELPNTLDLRVPDTQTWFFEHFVSLEETIGERGHVDPESGNSFATYKYHKPHDFVDLLPTLVMPGVGGSTFHQAVGAWLRSHGVLGLVYPSARCNGFMQRLRDEPKQGAHPLAIAFSGWTFVDYRDAGPAPWDPLFGRLSTWVLPQKAGITVMRHEGDQYGWQITGAEEGERRRILLAQDIMTGKVTEPPDWDPRGGFRRPYHRAD